MSNPMAGEHDAVMTIDELAGSLKTSKPTLYELARSNEPPGRGVGRRPRHCRQAVDR